jgi:hypothetical protein
MIYKTSFCLEDLTIRQKNSNTLQSKGLDPFFFGIKRIFLMREHFFKFCSIIRQFKNIAIIFAVVLPSIILICRCAKNTSINEQFLYFDGTSDKKAMLYKMIQDKKTNKYRYLPDRTITTQHKYGIPAGHYFLVNDCSSYAFQVDRKRDKKIYLNTLKLKFLEEQTTPADSTVESLEPQQKAHSAVVECVNPITGEKSLFSDRDEFDILPGTNQLLIAGMETKISALENEKKIFAIGLAPLTIVSPIENDTTQYFLKPVMNSADHSNNNMLYSGKLNQDTWLIPGEYDVEINGTKKNISLRSGESVKIELGRLRIMTPKDFAANNAAKTSLQPIFAYMDKQILFSLDKDYAILPGKYSIRLENSDMEQPIEILPNSYTKIFTFVAQINAPNCINDKNQKCAFSQRALIYSKDRPYPLSKVFLGVPFLVLQGDYEYGIEGADRIKKWLSVSDTNIKSEQTGRIKIKWKLEMSENNSETRKIYLEARCCNLAGKSEDLNAYRPRELVLPEGDYTLNYVVKQNKGGLKHNATSLHIDGKHDLELEIPVYAGANQNTNLFFQDDRDPDNPQQPSNLTPLMQ